MSQFPDNSSGGDPERFIGDGADRLQRGDASPRRLTVEDLPEARIKITEAQMASMSIGELNDLFDKAHAAEDRTIDTRPDSETS